MNLGVNRVVCGISGGVDSAVAALLLKRQGHEVIGAFMKNWDRKDEVGSCQEFQVKDRNDAEKLCQRLRIPFVEVSFIKEYWNDVFENFVREYEEGRTPNPDIYCNRFVKFGAFREYAMKNLGADMIATGHYARTSKCLGLSEEERLLCVGFDALKDQTLFLSHIEQKSLQKTIFPLGAFAKPTVRSYAKHNGLEYLCNKPDSHGICFIGNRSFPDFITNYVNHSIGKFVDIVSRHTYSEHKGIHHWTIGQRCRIGGLMNPVYVAHMDPSNQTVYVCRNEDHRFLYSLLVYISKPHWISQEYTDQLFTNYPLVCSFKFQHTRPCIPCTIGPSRTDNIHLLKLAFPTRAITPGQRAVFYQRDICLGSAQIIWSSSLSECCRTAGLEIPSFVINEDSDNFSKI